MKRAELQADAGGVRATIGGALPGCALSAACVTAGDLGCFCCVCPCTNSVKGAPWRSP